MALLGVVTRIGKDPDKLCWDAILTFCIHLLGVMAIAAPVLGGMIEYESRFSSVAQRKHSS